MSQNPSRSCQRCGTPLAVGQQFCSNCGATQNYTQYEPTALSQPTPTPPPGAFPQQVQQRQQSQSSQPMHSNSQGQQGFVPVPAYAQKQKNSTGRVLGGIGCGVLVVVLVVLLALGAGGYFLYRYVSGAANSITSGSNTTGGTTNGVQPPIKTTPINLTVTYSEVATTIVDAKLSQKFTDDPDTSGSSVLRLDLNEHNMSTGGGIAYLYFEVAHLLLPGGQSSNLGQAKNSTSPQKQATQTNWLDFSVPANLNVSQATLELGSSTKAKMDIPLKAGSDISKYQPKTVSLNTTVQYGGLTWNITSASRSFSAEGAQADTGMRYVTLTLKADNSTSQGFDPGSNGIGGYMRLRAGSVTSSPESVYSTFPGNVAANTTGTNGTVIFIVPEGNTAYTFILLADTNNQYPQVTTDFQIP